MNILRCSYLFLACFAITLFSCDKRKNCDGQKGITYGFDLPVTISPIKDTFNVGDTIWIENSFSDKLLNHRNSKAYHVVDFDFQNFLNIVDLTGTLSSTYPSPTLIVEKGEIKRNEIGNTSQEALLIDYDYKDNEYRLKAGFVVGKAGLFLINLGSYKDMESVDITACENEDMIVTFNTNNKGDNNYPFIKNAQDKFFNVYTKERFDEEGGYCFYVK